MYYGLCTVQRFLALAQYSGSVHCGEGRFQHSNRVCSAIVGIMMAERPIIFAPDVVDDQDKDDSTYAKEDNEEDDRRLHVGGC